MTSDDHPYEVPENSSIPNEDPLFPAGNPPERRNTIYGSIVLTAILLCLIAIFIFIYLVLPKLNVQN
ncbi:hypothetical protein NEAUS04_1700 [Nematocida ausubeli]|uniref:Uncharacterized protein n=1 Tax=Nematocida ausubeli (strain ATCC PRA-371 / ERTm2) TaxID=1913371 RepID=A0A086J1T7_NEMA1|nr:uncharacterized protein NESG_01220 [Nematocida ausubeli]KAI5137469.1 hypothetical protein NEAUS06_2247 [Nematocida ausubeli]KAI5137993.1 hypothetical protein NEAUS07_2195 [Nematocida ausubeli]KAI5148010.1 hypothetical protein NEAUS05_1216 [Nematocida ausubeli]KAI5163609.1 hypothetical protein NEAUS04_1700 [Nematocida ausubeli]KFG26105.1 hypothetical protein NESG_01220 [Nematocida ausubeli]